MTNDRVPLFPLSSALYPEGLLRLTIFEVRYLHLIRRCQQENLEFGVVPLASGKEVQKAGEIEALHDIGCTAQLLEVHTIQPAVLSVSCVGIARFRLGDHARGAYGLWSGDITRLDFVPQSPIPQNCQPIADRLGELIASAQREGLEAQLPMRPPYRLDDAGWVADRWAELLPLSTSEKAALLAQTNALERLQFIGHWL